MAITDLLGSIMLRLADMDEHTLQVLLKIIEQQGTIQALKPGQRFTVETDGHAITAKAAYPATTTTTTTGTR